MSAWPPPSHAAVVLSSQIRMMLTVVLCLWASAAFVEELPAQGLRILSTMPADSSIKVPVNTGIEFLFDHAIDTTASSAEGLPIGVFVGPRDSLTIGRHRTSDERTKLIVDVTHTRETDFTWVVTGAEGADTTSLDVTHVIRYTTAAEWGAYAVRGSVARFMAVKRGDAHDHELVVALLDEPLAVDSNWTFTGFDRIVAATVVPEDGEFVIDRVRNGTYWPVAFIDIDGNGRIDGDDHVGAYRESERESIIVQGEDVDDVHISIGVGGSTEPQDQPSVAELGDVYPNPAQGAVRIELTLAPPMTVTLGIFNLLGQEVRQLAQAEFLPTGSYQIRWDSSSLAAGAYVCRLQVNGSSQSRLFFVTR